MTLPTDPNAADYIPISVRIGVSDDGTICIDLIDQDGVHYEQLEKSAQESLDIATAVIARFYRRADLDDFTFKTLRPLKRAERDLVNAVLCRDGSLFSGELGDLS